MTSAAKRSRGMPAGFTDFDPAEHLTGDTDRMYDLNAAFSHAEADLAAEAIGDCVRALGVNKTVAATGLSRAALYKSLKIGGNPRLSTVLDLLKSMGYEIGIRPAGTWTALADEGREFEPLIAASGTVGRTAKKRATVQATTAANATGPMRAQVSRDGTTEGLDAISAADGTNPAGKKPIRRAS